MATTPINPNIDLYIDMETTRLSAEKHAYQQKHADDSLILDQVDPALEKQVLPTEVSFIDTQSDSVTHFTFDNLRNDEEALDAIQSWDAKTVFRGNTVNARVHSIRMEDRAAIDKVLKRSGIPSNLQEQYLKQIYPNIKQNSERGTLLYEIDHNNQKVYHSDFSKRYMSLSAKEQHAKSLENIKRIARVNSNSSVRDFANFDKFVNEFAQFVVASANSPDGVNIGAWNAQFESQRIAGWIYNYADPKLKKAYVNLVESGKIKYFGLENSYIDVMYGLAKKDSDLMSSMRIPMRTDTFATFQHRAGMAPRTVGEFQAALPWKQEQLFDLMKGWFTPAKEIVAAGAELHGSGVDIALSKDISLFFNKIKEEAMSIAKGNQSFTGKQWLELVDSEAVDGRSIIKQAFENVLVNEGYANNAKHGNKIANQFVNKIFDIAKQRGATTKLQMEQISKAASSLGPGYGSDILQAFKNVKFSAKSLKANGILAGFAGLALASTYLAYGDTDISYGNRFGSIGKIFAGKKDDIDTFENTDGPYLHSHIGDTIGWTAATIAGLGVIGYKEGIQRGNLLGVGSDFSFSEAGVTGTIKQTGKLVRTGIHTIESNFPLARVFKLGSAIDYTIGRQSVSVPIFNAMNPGRVGTVNIDGFMDALKTADIAAYNNLNNYINGVGRANNIRKSTLIISKDENGNAIIKTIDVNDKGVISYGSYGKNGTVLDIKPDIVNTSRANLSGRGEHPTSRNLSREHGRIRNTLAEDVLASSQTRLGKSTQKSFEEFYSQFNRPSWVTEEIYKGYKYLQYLTNIGPKGIHLGEDIFTNYTNNLGKVRTYVSAKSIGGNGTTIDNIRLIAQKYGAFGREFLNAGNRFLESPFEIFIDPVKIQRKVASLKGSRSSIKQIAGSILEKIESPHLGLNINNMKYGSLEYAGKFALKRVLPAYLAYFGLKTADSLMGTASFSSTGRGPVSSTAIGAYQSVMLGYSKISDLTGLTSLAKKQEKYAPGSTGLGVFAFPATLAGTYGIAQAVFNRSPRAFKGLVNKFAESAISGDASSYRYNSLARSIIQKFSGNSYVQEALRFEAYAGATNKSLGAKVISSFIKNPKSTIFAAASTLLVPFLPGIIGSTKSYSERKAEYAGQKDVAIRKNRGWLLSSGAFEGQGIGQYRQHGAYLYGSNWENNGVIWPSYSSRLLHAATLGLANRYVLEEYHKEAQPVYETAPYGSGVPVIGPVVSKAFGWLMKPVKRMHEEYDSVNYNSNLPSDYTDRYRQIISNTYNNSLTLGTKEGFNILENTLPHGGNGIKVKSVASSTQMMSQLSNQVNDLVGFKGFAFETIMEPLTGKTRPDEYTPYLKSAIEMYNPSQYLWQYNSGDFSLAAGEFLRRGFVKPRDRWEINNLPNELSGQTWIPKRLQAGTTFDSMPMGWLYASKKGWEFMYPEVRGKRMEDYPDNIKLDILKYMAPNSIEFNNQLKLSTNLAINNKLSPFEEQRVYDAAEERVELNKRINSRKRQYQYEMDMEQIHARITGVDLASMTFTTDLYGDKRFTLAGVSASESQIRAGLLKKKHYSNSEDLASDAQNIQNDIINRVNNTLQVGSEITFSIPGANTFSGKNTEAIVGSLNSDILNAGSPLIDTGNVSQYNLTQDEALPGAGLLGRYWDKLTDHNNYFTNRLLGNKDYITKYKNDRIFNMQVKLWSKPIEHYLQPIIAGALNNLGVNITPSFTKERRRNEQYWDVIKYIKYKTLATKAEYSNQSDIAEYYKQLADQTMVGTDPMTGSEGIRKSLPSGDRDYFDYFSNEPDAKRRGKILGLVSAPQKRIYNAIWLSKLVRSGKASNEQLEEYNRMKETGGYAIDDSILDDWRKDTNQQTSLKDYVRARFIQNYLKHNNIPDESWSGWRDDVDIDNVAVHSLLENHQQVQDYGYFDEQKRSAAYDKMAYLSSQQMKSTHLTSSGFIGNIMPALMSRSNLGYATGLPTTSEYSINNSVIDSGDSARITYINSQLPSYAKDSINSNFM